MNARASRPSLLLCATLWAIPGASLLTTSCMTASKPVKEASTQSLLGTPWRLALLGGEAIENPPGEQAVHIQLQSSNSALTGFAGCNRMFGRYALDGAKLKFDGMGSTRMFCQARMDLEQKFLVMFEQVAGWKLEGSTLHLLDAAGESLATFETP